MPAVALHQQQSIHSRFSKINAVAGNVWNLCEIVDPCVEILDCIDDRPTIKKKKLRWIVIEKRTKISITTDEFAFSAKKSC